MKFSVLMSIYYKENQKYFDRAMRSIWDDQTIKPDEIILVLDGTLTEELYLIIEKWKKKITEVLKVIPLEHNVGLGDALNEGISHCRNELIARMDTDDISRPDRFEKQLEIFKNMNIAICSSWISEFDDDENTIISQRKIPEFHNEIMIYSRKRSPVNHPATMYKKSFVENAGGYKKMIWFEDYYLWARMIMDNATFYNIQEPLVNMRAGYTQLQRRSGIRYIIEEFNFLLRLKEIKFLTSMQFLKNVIIRFVARILPQILLKHIYKKIREI